MSMIAFYTGASGMRTFQEKLNVISHNLANVNTYGFKAGRSSFEELLYSRMNTNVEGDHLVGHGVKQAHIDQLMAQSGFDNTTYQLDFAIAGDGFFKVEVDGEEEYTRNGAFTVSVEGGNAMLVSNDGAYVLDRNGGHITVPKDSTGKYDYAKLTSLLGVYTFPNQWGLEPKNNARYAESENSGEAKLAQPGSVANGDKTAVMQGYLERSNVEMANEMVGLTMAQRAFQINSRVLQTADQIAEQLNNLR